MDIILYKPSPYGPNNKESKTHHSNIQALQITSTGVIYFVQHKVKDGVRIGGMELVCTNMPFKIIATLEERERIERII